MSRKTIMATLAGLAGGLAASALLSVLEVRYGAYSQTGLALLIGITVGVCIPGAINAVPGLLAGQLHRAWRNAALAAGIGAAAMTVVSLGLARLVPRDAIFFQGSLLLGLLAWVLFGLALGATEGLVWRSSRRALLGAAGGGIGALLAFSIGTIINNEGAFILVGPLVGMGANLLPDMLKTAWVKVVNGSRQFEISLDKPAIVFGSSDDPRHADVGLYGDRGIAPRHFLLERKHEGYALTPLAQTAPVLINGVQAQATIPLQPGDVIAVGRAQIVFYGRAT